MTVFFLAFVTKAVELLQTLTIPFQGKTMIFSDAYRDRTDITDVIIEEGYEAIGLYAFAGSSVEKVTLPSTLKEIAEGAFKSSKLVSVVIPKGTTTLGLWSFQSCSRLVYVELSETVINIDRSVFASGNKDLEIIVHPDNPKFEWRDGMLIETISPGRKGVNMMVDKFRSFTFPSDVQVIMRHGAGSMYMLESAVCPSVDTFGEYAFRFDSALKNVTLSSVFTSCDFFCFEGCNYLEDIFMTEESSAFKEMNGVLYQKVSASEVKLFYVPAGKHITTFEVPKSIRQFDNSAFMESSVSVYELEAGHEYLASFSGCIYSSDYEQLLGVPPCVSATDFKFHTNCVSIGVEAFLCQKSLTTVNIPHGVTFVGEWAFSRCRTITSITFPDTVETIQAYALHEMRMPSFTVPKLVTVLPKSLFAYAHIRTLVIEGDVLIIDQLCFSHCGYLIKLNFPESLQRIESQAFCCCTVLPADQLVLPDSLTYIGESAFEYCSGIVGNITIPASVQVIDTKAFFMCTGIDSVTVVNCNTYICDNAFHFENNVVHITCVMTKWFTPQNCDLFGYYHHHFRIVVAISFLVYILQPYHTGYTIN